MNFGETQWTVVVGARDGDLNHLETLFRTYETPIRTLIAFHRRSASKAQIDDLVQGFYEICLRRDFLRNVDRGKGRFRHFLQVCLRNYLRDDARRPVLPINEAVVVGSPVEDGEAQGFWEIEVAVDASEDWRALDEPWALKIHRDALLLVERKLASKGRSPEICAAVRRRLDAEVSETTIEEEAARLGIEPADLNSLVHRARFHLRETISREISRQVDPHEFTSEFNYFIEVLTRIQRRKTPSAGANPVE